MSPFRCAMHLNVQWVIGSVLILLTCILGDRALEESWVSKSLPLRVIVDSVTHGLIGLFWWLVIVSPGKEKTWLFELFIAYVLASAVDIDHFISARSVLLKDALNLQERPPFHNSLVIPIFAGIIYVLCMLLRRILPIATSIQRHLPWMLCATWISHHIRDGTRRGILLAPFGSTPPVPRWLYLMLNIALPTVGHFFYRCGSDCAISEEDHYFPVHHI